MSREARAAKIVADLIIPSERRFYAAYADFQRTLKAEQLRRLRELPKGTPAASLPFALQPWQAAVWQATRKTYATIIRVGIGAGIAEVEATRKGFHGEQRLTRVVRDFAERPLEITIPRGYQEAIQATVATSRERIARRIYEQIEITGLDDRDALATAVETGDTAAIGAGLGQVDAATKRVATAQVQLGKHHKLWAERTELTGPNGGPIKTEQVNAPDLSKLTIDELRSLREMMSKAHDPADTRSG